MCRAYYVKYTQHGGGYHHGFLLCQILHYTFMQCVPFSVKGGGLYGESVVCFPTSRKLYNRNERARAMELEREREDSCTNGKYYFRFRTYIECGQFYLCIKHLHLPAIQLPFIQISIIICYEMS